MDAAATQSDAPRIDLQWQKPGGMWGLSFKIFFLKIITLGIYSFWGKTEVRRKIWDAVRLEGQPFEYTGTGKELFLGFLIVMAIGLPLYILAIVIPPLMLIVLPLFIYLIGVAVWRARRYRLSRTNWRGIRGGMNGSGWKFGWTYIWTGLLNILTLGWLSPWRNTKLYGILTRETEFGNQALAFDGTASPLYGRFAMFWVLGAIIYGIASYAGYVLFQNSGLMQHAMMNPGQQPPPDVMLTFILGVYAILIGAIILIAIASAFYKSYELNYLTTHTTYDSARFSLNTTAGSLIGLIITNLLLVLFTLGIAAPIALTRMAGYMVNRAGLHGSINFAGIAQNQQAMSKTGEGLAQAFDVDAL